MNSNPDMKKMILLFVLMIVFSITANSQHLSIQRRRPAAQNLAFYRRNIEVRLHRRRFQKIDEASDSLNVRRK
jgi:hypothetical protein